MNSRTAARTHVTHQAPKECQIQIQRLATQVVFKRGTKDSRLQSYRSYKMRNNNAEQNPQHQTGLACRAPSLCHLFISQARHWCWARTRWALLVLVFGCRRSWDCANCLIEPELNHRVLDSYREIDEVYDRRVYRTSNIPSSIPRNTS